MDTDRSLSWAPSDTIPDGALSTVRICSKCGSAYDSSASYCHRDGTRLGSGGGATVTVAPVYVVAARNRMRVDDRTLADVAAPFEAEAAAPPAFSLAGLPRGAIWQAAALTLLVLVAMVWVLLGH